MNIQSIRYIIAVEHYRSINKAAQSLYVSQSSISRAIKEVEGQIGIALFHRTSKGVIPTIEGERFIDQAHALLREIEQLEKKYFNSHSTVQDTLLVATQRCTPVIHAFIQYYQRFCTEKEFLNLAIQEDTTEAIIQLVASGTYGVGVLHYTSDHEEDFLRRCQALNLSYHLLSKSPVCAQVRAGHPLSKYAEISTDMLDPYPHLTFSDEDITCINYCSDVSQYNPGTLKKRIVLQDRGTFLQILKNTDSYYVGCDFSWLSQNGSEYGTSPPVYIPLADVEFTINTIWVQRNNRSLTGPETLFVQLLEQTFVRNT